MGAGILPTTMLNGKLHFLFGKENKHEDSAPGFSDFGGGTDNKETFLQTAVREGGEELTGFLGSGNVVKKMLSKHGTYNIDYKSNQNDTYRMHIFPMEYNPFLELYYNNNQKFIQAHLDPSIIKQTKIFEKEEIRWICVDDLDKMKPEFRFYFVNIVEMLIKQQQEIENFIVRNLKKGTKKKTLRKQTKKKRG